MKESSQRIRQNASSKQQKMPAEQASVIPIEYQFVKDILHHLSYLFQKIMVYRPAEPLQYANGLPFNSNDEGKKMEEERNMLQNNNDSLDIPSVEEISQFQSVQRSQNKKSGTEKGQRMKDKLKKIKKRKYKKQRSNDPTKKPISSFVFFYKDRVKTIKLENKTICQSLNSGNLAKIISNEWKKLTDEQKQPYVCLSKQSLKIYYAEKNQQKLRMQSSKRYLKRKDSSQLEQQMEQNQMQASQNQRKISHQDKAQDSDDNYEKTFLKSVLSQKQMLAMKKNGSLQLFMKYLGQNYSRLSKKYNEYKKQIIIKHAFKQWRFLLNKSQQNQNDIYEGDSSEQNSQREDEDDDHDNNQRRKRGKRYKRKEIQQEYKPKKYYRNIIQNKNTQHSEEDNKRPSPHNENEQISRGKASIFLKLDQIKQQTGMKQRPFIQQEDYKDENRYTIIEVNSNEQIIDEIEKGQTTRQRHSMVSGSKRQRDGQSSIKKARKPTSPFLIYYQDVLKTLMSNNQKTHGSELVKLASTMWGGLTEEQKLIYHDLARKNRQNIQVDARQLNEMKTRKKNKLIGPNS